MSLKGKKILIGISGSIAAYKIPYLVRLLIKEGAEVQVLMTHSAHSFVTPLTLSTLSGKPVLTEDFNPEDGNWNSHVDMGTSYDLYLLAPVSANTLSKMASGAADNLVLTTYLAARCPVFCAPAMDLDMFEHPSTRKNIDIIKEYGVSIIKPTSGELASGLCGAGRLEEPEVIVSILSDFFKKKKKFLNKKVLISAGPTFESIDPVRFIGNHSSGKMGFAIAEAFANLGADVCLVAGPVSIDIEHSSIRRINVVSAAEMKNAIDVEYSDSDVVIMAAAVADYTPASKASSKIKKAKVESLQIELEPTEDILASLGKKKKQQLLIGFALETNNERDHALDKLKRKNLDMIILNSLRDPGAGFGHDTNKVTYLWHDGREETGELKTKREIAVEICEKLVNFIEK